MLDLLALIFYDQYFIQSIGKLEIGLSVNREGHGNLENAYAGCLQFPLPEAEVLARVVALNRERQAEEAAGLVRYLRPSFQAPGETTQATLAIAAPAEAASTAEPVPWPSETKDRALALRRILREADRPLGVEAVAQRFKRAPRKAVADLLDTLAELGQARHAEGDTYAA